MESQEASRRAGLWVQSQCKNRFLDSPTGIKRLLELVDKHQITDIFLQVFRSGRAWFPSQIFESGTADSRLLDLLPPLLERGVQTQAWINVCNAGTTPSARYVEILGADESFLIDSAGRNTQESLLPFEIDTPGLWLEPSNPKLVLVLKTISEELAALPFSGVHLDFIRYPYALPIKPASWIDCGLDFGYSQQALDRFLLGRTEMQYFHNSRLGGILPSSEANGQTFDLWRREQINKLIAAFKETLPEGRLLSVAALAWSDRAYLNAYQDWRHWLSSNLIDELCLMSYSADIHLVGEQLRQAKSFIRSQQNLFAGIGLYKLSSLSELQQQLKVISDLGASPCYFCADQLLEPAFQNL